MGTGAGGCGFGYRARPSLSLLAATTERAPASTVRPSYRPRPQPEPRRSQQLPAVAMSLVNVKSKASSDLVDTVHEFVTTYVTSRFAPGTAQALALATRELLVNAVSYAATATEISYDLCQVGDAIEVVVSNETAPSRADRLRDQVYALQASPEETYSREMRRSETVGQRACLGLARIVHDVGMSLDVCVDGHTVEVRARLHN